MKINYRINSLFVLMVTFGLFFTACSKNDDDNTQEKASELTQKVNLFIHDVMNEIYLWNDELPDIDYRYQNDSKEYFESLLYEEDKWSFITDDVDALLNSFEGIETSYGWSLAFYYKSSTGNDVIAVVEYVYPNTPADNAGIKRGDVIVGMNGSSIDDTNYSDLLYSESMTITLGITTWSDDGYIQFSDGASADLVAEELSLNPVVKTKIVETEGHTIGYIFYAQYIDSYTDAIDTALQSMLNKNVTDLVLDLRYNPGGSITSAVHLCSSVAPLSAVNGDDPLVTFQWNDDYQEYWESHQVTSQVRQDFDNTVAVKMGLDAIHILTGSGTASASELTITGLSPYMTVTTVGDTTYGKYTGSITLQPEDFYDESDYYDEINNWGLQPIVLRYANAWGVTDFKDGFAPDLRVQESLFNAYPLGDVNDPLFAAAIADITGTSAVVASKSAEIALENRRFLDRGFSRFDPNKRELSVSTNNFVRYKKN